MKSYLLFSFFFLCAIVANSQDLYSFANAASISNESNSTSGWTGPAEIESTDDEHKSGQYSIKITSEDNGRFGQFSFDADAGTTYAITIWAKRGQSSNGEFDKWEGFSGFEKRNINGQGWKEYVFILTATQDHPVIKVFATKNNHNDREVFVDAITIYSYQEEDIEPPTNPSALSASNITSTSVNLSWNGSSDNTGVTGYRIYMNDNSIGVSGSLTYSVTSLSPETTYSYYVKAYDGAGNQSGPSNMITVTTLPGGNGGGGGGTGGGPAVYNVENANLPTVNWQALNFYSAGSVGIGTEPSNQFRLSVNGRVRAKEVIVETGWSDFVFEPGYRLPSLTEVENHINQYGHLKDIPAAATIEKDGIPVGEMNKLLLQKIEELTLYMIDAHKEINALKEENEILKSRIDEIER